MRTQAHIIDTRSIKAVLNLFPHHWVVRDLTERDYGIDLVLEIFTSAVAGYESTGRLLNIQVKGTGTKIRNSKDGTIHYSCKTNTLKYVERFAVPFILIRISLQDNAAYFVWLQRYIKDVLEHDCPDWRNKNSSVIKIPAANHLPDRIEKLEKIASRIKYVEELVEFHELYTHFEQILDPANQMPSLRKIELLKEVSKKIGRLYTLLEQNDCCVNNEDIKNLEADIPRIVNSQQSDFAQKHNLELLNNQVSILSFLESLGSDDSQAVY